MPTFQPIPILLLTGFLGSGKTTLLRQLLSGADAKETAVIVNEFGEIGLDHELLIGASESMFVLENGCVCCSVRDDLEASLEELFWGRLRREIPWFSRVVIETTGLADPYRVVEIVGEKSLADERFQWTSIAAAVDGVIGARTLESHAESVAQAAIADHLIVTKTDLADNNLVEALERRLRILNPDAGLYRSRHGDLGAPLETLMIPAGPPMQQRRPDRGNIQPDEPAHLTEVAACWFRLDRPVTRDAFQQAFGSLLADCGVNILRAKGLVAFSGENGLAVVQYVDGGELQLDAASFKDDGIRSSGLVVIAHGLDEHGLTEKFAATGLGVVMRSDAFSEHHHHHDHPDGGPLHSHD